MSDLLIVEFMKNELIVSNTESFIDKAMVNTRSYQDHFQVYLQTLISQALDASFLPEILEEKDHYFLTNIQVIENLTEDRKRRMIDVVMWPKSVVQSIGTWPCFNLNSDLGTANLNHLVCNTCLQPGIATRLLLYGQPYHQFTLEAVQVEARMMCDKELLMCRLCSTKVELLHKISHQKYLTFIECAKIVAQKTAQNNAKSTTDILNELLADEPWLTQVRKRFCFRCIFSSTPFQIIVFSLNYNNIFFIIFFVQIFKNFRRTWAEVELVEHRAKYQT